MTYSFADCELDIATHSLRRNGAAVHVEPQVFDVLAALARSAPDLVLYDDLIAQVWSGRIVSDATMASRISSARAAVGDTGKAQSVIRTIPRRGVQMVCAVAHDNPERQGGTPTASFAQIIRTTKSKDGSGIAWSTCGEGPPLLRGGHWMTHLERDMDSVVWGPWIERLGRGRRLVRYDPRGTGLSDHVVGSRSLDRHIEDLMAVADAANLDRFAIYGTSQSAAVVCGFAARYPERVSHLIIHGGFAQGSFVREGPSGAVMTQALSEMIRKGWGSPDGGHMRAFSSLFMPGASEAQMRDFVAMQLASSDPETAVDIRNCCAGYDVVDILSQIQAPTLVTHAARDALHPYSQAQIFAREIPDAQLVQLDSDNHVLLPGEPAFEVLMQAVDAFLAQPG